MTRGEWLASLTPGMNVAIDTGPGMGRRYHLVAVARRTATQIIIAYPSGTSETKFRATDGRQIDAVYSRRTLEPLTEEIRRVIGAERDASRLHYVDWTKETPETLRTVCALLDAPRTAAVQPAANPGNATNPHADEASEACCSLPASKGGCR